MDAIYRAPADHPPAPRCGQAFGKQVEHSSSSAKVRPQVFLDLQYLLHESKGYPFGCVWNVRHFPVFSLGSIARQEGCTPTSSACLTKKCLTSEQFAKALMGHISDTLLNGVQLERV